MCASFLFVQPTPRELCALFGKYRSQKCGRFFNSAHYGSSPAERQIQKGSIYMKKPIAMLLSLTMLAGLMAGCGSQSASSAALGTDLRQCRRNRSPQTEAPAPAPEESTKEEAISVDGSRFCPGGRRETTRQEMPAWTIPAIRMTSGRRSCWWSASAPATTTAGRLTIGAIEKAIAEAFPDYSVAPGLYQPDHH